jgi:hypothetical protein
MRVVDDSVSESAVGTDNFDLPTLYLCVYEPSAQIEMHQTSVECSSRYSVSKAKLLKS